MQYNCLLAILSLSVSLSAEAVERQVIFRANCDELPTTIPDCESRLRSLDGMRSHQATYERQFTLSKDELKLKVTQAFANGRLPTIVLLGHGKQSCPFSDRRGCYKPGLKGGPLVLLGERGHSEEFMQFFKPSLEVAAGRRMEMIIFSCYSGTAQLDMTYSADMVLKNIPYDIELMTTVSPDSKLDPWDGAERFFAAMGELARAPVSLSAIATNDIRVSANHSPVSTQVMSYQQR